MKVSAFSELKSAGHVTETEILASQEYRPNPFFGVYMFSFESFSAKMDSSSTRSLDVGLAMAESSGLSAFMASAFSPLAIQFFSMLSPASLRSADLSEKRRLTELMALLSGSEPRISIKFVVLLRSRLKIL